MTLKSLFLAAALALQFAPLHAQTLKVLTAGAFKAVVLEILPTFETRTGIRVELSSDTAGGVVKRVEVGQAFDVAIATHEGIQRLASQGALLAGAGGDVAVVGIGIGIGAGAPMPEVSTVDQFKRLLGAARAIAYIDPASGGSSGIYLDGLFGRLGVAEVVRPKAILVSGGLAAERIVRGEADLALQQVSEIISVKGVVLAGTLPEAIQSYTTYAAGISSHSASSEAARQLLSALSGKPAADIIRAKGMQPAP
jgi:molybdate transport system substrate-binding protein